MGVTPFLKFTDPYEYESLASVERRALDNNHCPSLRWAGRLVPALAPGRRARLPNLYYHGSLSSLSDLLLIPCERLHAATVHWFATALMPEDRLFHSGGLSFIEREDLRYFTLYPSARYCPGCISERRYHRIQWDLLPVTVCPTHGALLRDRCGACGGRISHQQVVKGLHTCGYDLRAEEMLPPPGGEKAWTAQTFILSRLGIARLQPIFPGDPALSLPSWSFFRLVDVLMRIIFGAGNSLSLFKVESLETDFFSSRAAWRQKISIHDYHILLLAAFTVLSDWPKKFFTFLDEYRARGRDSIFSGLSRHYRPLQELVAPGNGYAFVASAFAEYLCRWDGALLRASSKYVNTPQERTYVGVEEAAALLAIPYSVAQSLLKREKLSAVSMLVGTKRVYLVSAQSVRELARTWSGKLRIEQVAERLDVRVPLLRKLVRFGLLNADRVTPKCWLVAEPDLAFFESMYLTETASRAAAPEGLWFTLADAGRLLGFRADALAWTLIIIRSGALAARLVPGERGLSALRVYLGPLAVPRKGSRSGTVAMLKPHVSRDGFITAHHAAQLLRLTPPSVERYIAGGLIRCVCKSAQSGQMMKRIPYESFLRFRGSYILAREALAVLNVSRKTLLEWAASGLVRTQPVDKKHTALRPLYVRADVEKLAPENRLSLQEATARLSASEQFLRLLIRCGLLAPLKRTGKTIRLLRCDLEELRVQANQPVDWSEAAAVLQVSARRIYGLVGSLRAFMDGGPQQGRQGLPSRLELELLERGTLNQTQAAAFIHAAPLSVAKWMAESGRHATNSTNDHRYLIIDLCRCANARNAFRSAMDFKRGKEKRCE